ncbi:MAG: twin-arginine translocation signal domain-containing protein [Pyrinomonadaceae bacterium]|nr:twin-arginine translocation signal domain-containing protein [Pyrinomonadaceae bacterium]
MGKATRRDFLQRTALGLAGVSAAGFVLRNDAQPTLATVSGDEANRVLIQMGSIPREETPAKGELKRVTPVSFGPWYKTGAPFRAKLSLPGEPGTTFVLSGRAWAFETKRPLAGVVLDFWHVDMQEKYSDGVSDFRNRGRLVSSETGYYELESIRPIPYRPNPSGSPNFWRCAHFHLLAVCPGYKPLVTEIHFKEDPKMSDSMYRPENAIAPEKRTVNGLSFETGVFDIVLERETVSK